MPYDNLYNRKIGAENNRTDQLHIDNLKRDDLYFIDLNKLLNDINIKKELVHGEFSGKVPKHRRTYRPT